MNQPLSFDHQVPSILIAEDSPTQAEQIVQFLTQQGFAVHAARNGEEAYNLAATLIPDIIISDIVMPGIDGYELCRRIKSTTGLENTPVILVTALSQPQDVLAGLEAGADNFIIKPYDEQVLTARITYLLRNRGLRHAERSQEQLEVEFGGERHQITARKQQILDLLISTYAQAVHLFSALDQGRQELSQSYEALQALYEMSDGLNRCRTPADVATTAVTCGLAMPGVRNAWFYLNTGNALHLAAERHGPRAAQADPFPPSLVRDPHALAPVDEAGLVMLRPGISTQRQYASLKLQVGSQILGYLNLQGSEPTVSGEVAPHTLGSIASQLSIALERAVLHTELEAQVRKRTQLLIEEIEERRQATETITAIFNASPVALMSLDSQLCVSAWNRTASEIFRLPADAVLGRSWSSLFTTAPAGLANAISIIQTGRGTTPVEIDALLHDRTPRSLHIAGEPLIDVGGVFRGAVLAIDDITDIKQVKEQLHQAQKMEAVGNLTGGIAHDFNNLLTTIIGNLDLTMLKATPEQRPALDTALRASLRGSDLTKKLLAFARKQALDPQVVDPADIIDEVRLLLDGRMESRVSMTLSIAPDVPPIYADPTELETALINLAINARDAMPEGGTLDIHARYLPAGERPACVEFVVHDSGVGIPSEKLDRIFEPFFTTKAPGKGTGLGLAMVYGFASQSGGYLTVRSDVGAGTTFRLGLPAVGSAPAAPVDRAPNPEPLRVLLVERDPEICRAVEEELSRDGHSVIVAPAPEQAELFVADSGQVDLLMADVTPEGPADVDFVLAMLGGGACQRALLLSTDLPVRGTQGHDPNRYAVLVKPFRAEDLKGAIATLFGLGTRHG